MSPDVSYIIVVPPSLALCNNYIFSGRCWQCRRDRRDSIKDQMHLKKRADIDIKKGRALKSCSLKPCSLKSCSENSTARSQPFRRIRTWSRRAAFRPFRRRSALSSPATGRNRAQAQECPASSDRLPLSSPRRRRSPYCTRNSDNMLRGHFPCRKARLWRPPAAYATERRE